MSEGIIISHVFNVIQTMLNFSNLVRRKQKLKGVVKKNLWKHNNTQLPNWHTIKLKYTHNFPIIGYTNCSALGHKMYSSKKNLLLIEHDIILLFK